MNCGRPGMLEVYYHDGGPILYLLKTLATFGRAEELASMLSPYIGGIDNEVATAAAADLRAYSFYKYVDIYFKKNSFKM